MKLTKRENFIAIITIDVLSAAFIMICSVSTSPLVPNFYHWDSAIFQVVGKSWTRGIMPYAECFDHKGPLLFLLEAIGYMFGIGKVGVAIVQWISLSISFFFIYKIARLFMNSKLSLIT